MTEAEAVNQITLSSRVAVAAFLSTRPDPDETITWTCPECNAINNGTYHSHVTRCGACDKGLFPAIPLPIVGDAKTSVKRAFMNNRLNTIDEDIEEAKSKIQELEYEVENQEAYINTLEIEKNDINRILHNDLVSTGDA